MITRRCSLCFSRKIVYRNALFSMVGGLQVEYAVCQKHSAGEYRIEARLKAEKKLKRLLRARQRGKRLLEETCLLCSGTGQLHSERCWHCEGRGRVLAGRDSVNLVYAK